MKISVVIPFLDEEEELPATLARLARELSAHAGFEVVAVDGGSRDASRAVLAGMPWVRVLEAPRGRAGQLNAGAAAATGDMLLFLHADCLLPRDATAAIRNACANGARWGRFDITIGGRPWVLKVVAAMMNLRSRATGIATGDQGMFVERALFERVGGFASIPLMEDIALSRSLKRAAGRPACLRSRIVTSGRRWEAHGPWRTIFTMWWLRAAYALGVDPARLARRYR